MYNKDTKEKVVLGSNPTKALCFNDSEAFESLVFWLIS